LGLPTDRLARVSAFKHLKDAGDAPFAPFVKARVAAVDAGSEDIPSTYDSPPELYDEEILDTATDMRNLEAQYHPGYDFPAQNAAIDYFDSLDCTDDASIPDLYWPGDDFHDSPRDLITSSSYFDYITSAVAPPALSALLPASSSLSLSQLTGDGLPVLHKFTTADWSTNVLNATFGPTGYSHKPVVTPFLEATVAQLDGEVEVLDADHESTVLDDSVPPVPVPAEEIIPQCNGPGRTPERTTSYEPPHQPPNGDWWFHVDTGANVHVTCYPNELAHRVHSTGHCGTAGSSTMDVICEGMWILQGNPSDCPDFHAVITALGCPGAKRRSFSLHAMARSGYDCVHHVRSHIDVVHQARNTSYRLTCTTYRETDFI
jgi:hypothetical protein